MSAHVAARRLQARTGAGGDMAAGARFTGTSGPDRPGCWDLAKGDFSDEGFVADAIVAPLMRSAMAHFSSTRRLRGDDRPRDIDRMAKAGPPRAVRVDRGTRVHAQAYKVRRAPAWPEACGSPDA